MKLRMAITRHAHQQKVGIERGTWVWEREGPTWDGATDAIREAVIGTMPGMDAMGRGWYQNRVGPKRME